MKLLIFTLIFAFHLDFCILAEKVSSLKELLRRKRHLVFPNPLGSETKVQVLFGLGLPMEGEVAMTLGYVLKCNYKLPTNATVFTQQSARKGRSGGDEKDFSTRNREYAVSGTGVSRWRFYEMLESALEILGSGRACLLRAVCEIQEIPFEKTHGLLAQLLHVFLTPSTTVEEYENYSNREYHAAEFIGRNSGTSGTCQRIYRECKHSPLGYFSVYP